MGQLSPIIPFLLAATTADLPLALAIGQVGWCVTSRTSQWGLPYPYSVPPVEPERCRERWGRHSKGCMTVRDHTTHALRVVSHKTPAPLFSLASSFSPTTPFDSAPLRCLAYYSQLPYTLDSFCSFPCALLLSSPIFFFCLLYLYIFWVLVLLSHPSPCPPSSTPNTTTTTTNINHNTTLTTGCPQITTMDALVGARKWVSRTLNVNFAV